MATKRTRGVSSEATTSKPSLLDALDAAAGAPDAPQAKTAPTSTSKPDDDDDDDSAYDDAGAKSDDSDYAEKAPAAKKPRTRKDASTKTKAKEPKAPTKKAVKEAAVSAMGNCSLSKKDFGDRIKECLRLEKYEIQSMSFTVKMDLTAFKWYFAQSNIKIAPSDYNAESEVIVATLSGAQAGDVFGVSKVKNGNRYSTYYVSRMCIVFEPKRGVATVWVST